EKAFRLGYSRTRYGTGYYIYHLYDRSAKLSSPLHSWDPASAGPDKEVLELISRSGSDLVSDVAGLRVDETAAKGQTIVAMLSGRGPSTIRALEVSAPRKNAVLLGRGRIRVTWDNRAV